VNRYVNPANAITASRYVTLPLFVHWLRHGDVQLATLMVVVCGFLDLFDGMAARAFNCASGFGELLDAVTDAFCYGFFMVVLAIEHRLPWVPVGGILVIGVVNVLFRGIYARRAGRATNYRSYGMERVVAYAAYLAGLGAAGFEPVYFSWTCLGAMTVVLIHDTKRMLADPIPPAEAAA
jgi:phosphatidylglycerophosphate synthase